MTAPYTPSPLVPESPVGEDPAEKALRAYAETQFLPMEKRRLLNAYQAARQLPFAGRPDPVEEEKNA